MSGWTVRAVEGALEAPVPAKLHSRKAPASKPWTPVNRAKLGV